MLKIVKEKGIMLLTFLLFYFIFEILTFMSINAALVARYCLLDFIILVFIAAIIFIVKSKIFCVIYLSIWMLGIIALYLANATMYSVFGDIFSIKYLKLLSEAGEVFSWSFIDLKIVTICIILYLLYIAINILIVCLTKKIEYKSERSYFVNGFLFIVPILVILGFVFELNITSANNKASVNGRRVDDNAYVTNLTRSAISHYGMITLYYKELAIVTGTSASKKPLDAIYPHSNHVSSSPYNGLLEGKNVITIMVESLQDFAVNETLTPNLWKLKKEGLNFSNCYSVNKTNVSEQIGITGSYYPFNGGEYDVQFALPNMLNDTYATSYFHDNEPTFYSRGDLTRFFGFENSYFHEDLYPSDFKNSLYPNGITQWVDNSWQWTGNYTLDSVTINQALPNLTTADEPFYSFWTTLSMHGPYNAPVGYCNLPLFKKLGYYDRMAEATEKGEWSNPLAGVAKYEEYLEYYQAAVMDFDDALGTLLADLEEKNLLDDTLLVLYGDHHVYYHDIYLKMANTTNITEVDKLYKSTMIMYNPTLSEEYVKNNGTNVVDKFSSPYAVVPTILDVLGVENENTNYSNYSIFDERYIEAFYSYQQCSFLNDNFYTYDCENIVYSAYEASKKEIRDFLFDCTTLINRIYYTDDAYRKSRVE